MTDSLSSREIILKTGHVVLVDAADYDQVSDMAWAVVYAYRKGRKGRMRAVQCWLRHSHPLWPRFQKVLLHRMLLSFPDSIIDHINGNVLDNRRANLRLATPVQNAWNSGLRSNNTTGIKGAHRQQNGKFSSRIEHKRKRTYLGVYATAEEAGAAYRAAALQLHGEFARLK